MTGLDSQEIRARLMLWSLAEDLTGLMHCSPDETLEALLGLLQKGLVTVATDREHYWLELSGGELEARATQQQGI